MGNNIKNCLACQKNQYWVEIRLVDELNKPFGSLTGTLKDATGNIHAVTLTGGYLLLTDLPAGPVELKLETKALLTEAKKHKPRPMPQTSPAKGYADKNKGYQKSKIRYQYITLGDVWTFEPQIIPDRHRAGSTGQPLRMATNNSYFLEVCSWCELNLPAFIFKTNNLMDDVHADDMQCGDLKKERILQLGMFKPFNKFSYELDLPAEYHFTTLRALANFVSWGEYAPLTKIMIERFEKNIGTKFSHPLLDKAAKEHQNTKKIIKNIQDSISERINSQKGELNDNDIEIIYDELKRGKYIIHLPNFDTPITDWFNGLGITVHGIWSLWLTIESLNVDLFNKTFNGVVSFKIQDHFGLNEEDVNGSKYFELLPSFRSWFILQRYERFGFKPYITEMNHIQNIKGSF